MEREWTIIVYTATANNLEPYSFRNVAKLTASRPTEERPVALSMLIATSNYGNWQFAYDGNPDAITMRRLDRLHLYELSNLTDFIRESAAKIQFKDVFSATVIDYRQDLQKSELPYAKNHHGLSIAVNAQDDPTDAFKRYSEISLPLHLRTASSPTN